MMRCIWYRKQSNQAALIEGNSGVKGCFSYSWNQTLYEFDNTI